MEPDGITRVWLNIPDPEIQAINGVTEMFPEHRYVYIDTVRDEEADAIRARADVAFQHDGDFRYDRVADKFVHISWLDVLIIETGELIKIEYDDEDHMGPHKSGELVAKTVENHLGKTGLTIITGS